MHGQTTLCAPGDSFLRKHAVHTQLLEDRLQNARAAICLRTIAQNAFVQCRVTGDEYALATHPVQVQRPVQISPLLQNEVDAAKIESEHVADQRKRLRPGEIVEMTQ